MAETDRVVVVTGAGAGIGRAIAELHARRGWSVIGIERDRAKARELASLDRIVPVTGDVTDDAVLLKALKLASTYGRLEAWVNNAAAVHIRPLPEVDTAHIETMLRTNIQAVVRGTQLAVGEFLATGTEGSIVTISSVHARLAFAAHALYDTSKGAVEALCRSVAAELGPRGIRCNAVAPGAVMTETQIEARRVSGSVNEPIPRAMFSSPADIAAVVAFLTDPSSAAINGAVIAADRGLSTTFLDEQWHSAKLRR